jgi:DNA-binding transcriptional regulator YdaS (Cro superfamily)
VENKCHLALLKACRILGGQKQLAEQIKIHPSRLNKWINRRSKIIPFACALEIERATGGQVMCHEFFAEWGKVWTHFQKRKQSLE